MREKKRMRVNDIGENTIGEGYGDDIVDPDSFLSDK